MLLEPCNQKNTVLHNSMVFFYYLCNYETTLGLYQAIF